MTDEHRFYEHHDSWHRFRALLASRLDLTLDREPLERFVAWEGHDIHVDEWPCVGEERGVVLLVHGGGGHGRLLAPLGHALSARGFRCLAPDLPGYGLTQVRAGWKADYAEWPALVAWLAGRQQGPVALFGLSMGGLTAVFGSQHHAVSAVVTTTLLDLSESANVRRAARHPWLGAMSQLGFRHAAPLLDPVALPLSLVAPLRKLIADPALADSFVQDPLIGRRRVPLRFWRTANAYRGPARLSCRAPLALFHPGADAWTPTALSRETLERIDAPSKSFLELSNGSHAPFERPARDELVAATVRFLDASLAPALSLG